MQPLDCLREILFASFRINSFCSEFRNLAEKMYHLLLKLFHLQDRKRRRNKYYFWIFLGSSSSSAPMRAFQHHGQVAAAASDLRDHRRENFRAARHVSTQSTEENCAHSFKQDNKTSKTRRRECGESESCSSKRGRRKKRKTRDDAMRAAEAKKRRGKLG